MSVKCYHLLVLTSTLLYCYDTAASTGPGPETEAACTAANLSVHQFQLEEEDRLGEVGGKMDFYCCQRQEGPSSECVKVHRADYYFNGNPINASDVDKYDTRNEGGAQLIVLDLAMTDQGRYTCACPDTGLSPEDPEDSGIVLLFPPERRPVFPYRVEEGTTALLSCPLSGLLNEYINSYIYRWDARDIEISRNRTLCISNVSSGDAQRRYQCIVTGFQREGREMVHFPQSPSSDPISLLLIKSLDLNVHLSSGVLVAGSNITAQCLSASGRNLSLASEVTIDGIPVTETDGYSLQLTHPKQSGVVICKAVQRGNNSIDLNDRASVSFTVLDMPHVTFLSADMERLLQRFSLTHSSQSAVALSVEFIVSNAESAQTHFLPWGECAPPIIQGSQPTLVPDAFPPGTPSAEVDVDLRTVLPQLRLDSVMLLVQFRLVLDGVRGQCSLTAPLREPCPPVQSVFLVAVVTGAVVLLVTLAVTTPLTVWITLWCKKRRGEGCGSLWSNKQAREYSTLDWSSDGEGVERALGERSALLGHKEE